MSQRHSTRGASLIMLASLITMAICVYDYYTPETGLIGTGGVITVAVAGLLMLLASLSTCPSKRTPSFSKITTKGFLSSPERKATP